jgi:peptide-methionine (R)-S-oxide reductase
MPRKIQKSDAEWRAVLTPEEYAVTRQKGTERAFTGRYWDCSEPGRYVCTCCGADLFSSAHKFDSGCGWPSFHSAAAPENVEEAEDRSHFMVRTEVLCRECGAHLGTSSRMALPPPGCAIASTRCRSSSSRIRMTSAAWRHRSGT